MATRSWKFLNLRRLVRERTNNLPALSGYVPPYTLTYTGDELNSEFQAETIDWKGGDDVTAGEESGFNLLSELSVNDGRVYSDDISSLPSNTQDFEHLGEQQEEIVLDTGGTFIRGRISGENAVISKRLSERLGTIIARYSKYKYRSDHVRLSQSSSTNRSTSSTKVLLRRQLETSNIGSCDKTRPKKSFSMSTKLRRRGDFQNNQNHHLLHNVDDIQDYFDQDKLDSMHAQIQISNCKKPVWPESKSRTVASLDDDECELEKQDQLASPPASRCKHTMQDIGTNGFSVDKVEKLPSWSAERILYKRRGDIHLNSDLCRCGGADINHNLSNGQSTMLEFKIQEQDWWKTVREDDNHDTVEIDKSATGIDISNDTGKSLPLCAAEPMLFSDSFALSTRYSEYSKGFHNNERDDKTDREKVFYNVGLSIWNQSRAEWKSYTCHPDTTLCPSSSCDSSTTEAAATTESFSRTNLSGSQKVDIHSSPDSASCKVNSCRRSLTHTQYKELVQGLTNVTREYPLPKPMNLADLIPIYVDVWTYGHEM